MIGAERNRSGRGQDIAALNGAIGDAGEAGDDGLRIGPIGDGGSGLGIVAEADAPGVTQYRKDLNALLANRKVDSLPHEEIIGIIQLLILGGLDTTAGALGSPEASA